MSLEANVIVLLTNDLMFQSRVSGAVNSVGGKLIVDRSVEKLRDRATPNESVKLVLVDLSLQNVELSTTIPELKNAFSAARVLAFGPHVDVDRLEQAASAGADAVLTRGQFDRDLAAIVSVE